MDTAHEEAVNVAPAPASGSTRCIICGDPLPASRRPRRYCPECKKGANFLAAVRRVIEGRTWTAEQARVLRCEIVGLENLLPKGGNPNQKLAVNPSKENDMAKKEPIVYDDLGSVADSLTTTTEQLQEFVGSGGKVSARAFAALGRYASRLEASVTRATTSKSNAKREAADAKLLARINLRREMEGLKPLEALPLD